MLLISEPYWFFPLRLKKKLFNWILYQTKFIVVKQCRMYHNVCCQAAGRSLGHAEPLEQGMLLLGIIFKIHIWKLKFTSAETNKFSRAKGPVISNNVHSKFVLPLRITKKQMVKKTIVTLSFNQCCGSKYIEFGSGSGCKSGSGSRVITFNFERKNSK